MDTNTAAPFITLAAAEAIIGYDPSAFTDLAYAVEHNPAEYLPTCYLPRSDGSLRELTRGQVGNFPLTDPRLPGILMREADAHRLVEWDAGFQARRVAEDESAAWIAHLDSRGDSDWD